MTVAGRTPTDSDDAPVVDAVITEPRSGLRRLVDLGLLHPVWTAAIVAFAVRLVAVIALGPLHDGPAQPDEVEYLGVAASVAAGHGAEAWEPGYGGRLYDTTGTFTAPLAALTWLFGEHRLNGQVLAAVFGILCAVLTTWLAARVVRREVALLAGIIVALLPSQVFWSSVVLRESTVWAALALLAVIVAAMATARSDRRLVLLGLAGFATLLALCHLRPQTAIVATWSMLLAALVIVPMRRRAWVAIGALLVAVVAPMAGGLGPAGYSFVESAVPRLGIIRANLSLGANTSIVNTTPISPAPTATGHFVHPSQSPDGVVVTGQDGKRFLVDDETTGASLATAPSGLVAVTLRPFPWEQTHSTGVRMAKVENVGWLLLYVLAAAGGVVGRRRRDVLAFPVIVTGALLLAGAITQGNLGTAFRHRGQVLWALALLSAVAVQRLLDRRRTEPA